MPWIRWRHFKVLMLSLGGVFLLTIVFALFVNLWMLAKTHERIHSVVEECPAERVGIVFGTSRWTRGGGRNPHFAGRMQAATELVQRGKVEHLLLSGDNGTRYYNEPIVMWRDLRGRDVDDGVLTLDYAGFSTFDTLARAKQVFGLEEALLITQSWHLPRALFIADAMGIKAQGCAAPEDTVHGTLELRAREWAARVGTLGDLYLWQRKPRFLGPLELIDTSLDKSSTVVDEAIDTGVTGSVMDTDDAGFNVSSDEPAVPEPEDVPDETSSSAAHTARESSRDSSASSSR